MVRVSRHARRWTTCCHVCSSQTAANMVCAAACAANMVCAAFCGLHKSNAQFQPGIVNVIVHNMCIVRGVRRPFGFSHYVADVLMLLSRLHMHLQTGDTLHVAQLPVLHVQCVGRQRWPSSGGIGAK